MVRDYTGYYSRGPSARNFYADAEIVEFLIVPTGTPHSVVSLIDGIEDAKVAKQEAYKAARKKSEEEAEVALLLKLRKKHPNV